MMPMVEKELVEKDNLLTDENVIDDYAMGQSIPGIIGVNAAGLMGYRINGRRGLTSSVLGFITPSIIIITIISYFSDKLMENTILLNFFAGLRIGVVALMINALINIGKKSIKHITSYFILAASIVAVLFFSINPFILIISGGVLGYISYIVGRKKID